MSRTCAEVSHNFSDSDERFMRRALTLAARGRGRVEPNPMVGCVMVKGGKVVGEGWHRCFGGPHAEVEALRKAGRAARGATVYVTLEPCCHHGKTPPCTEALIAARVKRVVAAMVDPFPRVAGRGLQALRDAGIEVAVGLCRREAELLNAAYIKRVTTGRPWVILKWAQSIDGKLATRCGRSKWITCEEARRYAHYLRGLVDAVIVGAGTVRADDPLLTCRLARPRRLARRVVIDGRLSISPDCRLVRSISDAPVTVVTTERAVARHVRKYRLFVKAGCEVLALPEVQPFRVSLEKLLDWLGRNGATNILVEGGGEVLGQFLEEALGDEAVIFVAPILIGGRDAPGPWPAGGVEEIASSLRLIDARLSRRGSDWVIRGRLHYPSQA